MCLGVPFSNTLCIKFFNKHSNDVHNVCHCIENQVILYDTILRSSLAAMCVVLYVNIPSTNYLSWINPWNITFRLCNRDKTKFIIRVQLECQLRFQSIYRSFRCHHIDMHHETAEKSEATSMSSRLENIYSQHFPSICQFAEWYMHKWLNYFPIATKYK